MLVVAVVVIVWVSVFSQSFLMHLLELAMACRALFRLLRGGFFIFDVRINSILNKEVTGGCGATGTRLRVISRLLVDDPEEKMQHSAACEWRSERAATRETEKERERERELTSGLRVCFYCVIAMAALAAAIPRTTAPHALASAKIRVRNEQVTRKRPLQVEGKFFCMHLCVCVCVCVAHALGVVQN